MSDRAPGSLGLVQDFVNTLDVEEAKDAIREPAELAAWFVSRGLMQSVETTVAEHTQALELRECLRRLMGANNGGQLANRDLKLLNEIARASGVRPVFVGGSQVRLEPTGSGALGALGRLVAAVSQAMTDGSWHRLKACAQQTCRWAFYDRSKNRSGHWCSMAVCGNRSKAREFRRRRRSPAPA